MGSLMRDEGWVLVERPSPLSSLTPFHQRQTNRSPLDSPPIAKKLPKVKENNLFFGQMFVDLSSNSASPVYLENFEEKENRSILKKTGSRTLGRPSRPTRRVDFEQDVVVYNFDRIEGGHVSSESQRLSTDSKDRKEFVSRTMQGRNRPIALDSHSTKISIFGSREPPIQYATPLPVASSSSYSEPISITSIPMMSQYTEVQRPMTSQFDSGSQSNSFPVPITNSLDRRVQRAIQDRPVEDGGTGSEVQQEVDFSFFEDDHHRLRLKFTIALGDGVAANDVLVKANTAGNKVRLVGTRTVGTTRQGTIVRQEFTERYQLPMEVDPYMITARMDNNGNLFVEAPVMTADRRRAISVERQTINDATPATRIGADFVL